ncbi:MAG: MotA/TolQ/ExbB proton channel family protein [Bacteriovoracaceae bacterium]
MGIWTLIKEGGFIMYPLLIFSFAIWAVVFEKLWGLKQFNKEYKELHSKAYELLKNSKIQEAKGLYASADKLISGPHLVLLDDEQISPEKRLEKMHRRLMETQAGLKRFLWVLGTIGSSAPFVGLFGTVVGIIKSFESIASTGKSGFTVVASGISEALVATAAGIIVAVIAVIFYNYFQIKISRINLEFKNKLADLSDLILK